MVYGDQRGFRDKRVTLKTLRSLCNEGQPIACLTAYDASFARLCDDAGVDVVLVGDSLGMVVQGHASTVPVTVDQIVYHTKLVARGLSRALLMADLPFLAYHSVEVALSNAGRLMQEGGASIVKLEGTADQAQIVRALTGQGIPVCAHLGLRPQAALREGGFRVQGREPEGAKAMLQDAKLLEAAGADVLLLECVPAGLARQIAQAASVPVIGIGAGPDVHGQILVLYDILDITQGKRPRFARNFMEGHESPKAAVEAYVEAVRERRYPGPEHSF